MNATAHQIRTRSRASPGGEEASIDPVDGDYAEVGGQGSHDVNDSLGVSTKLAQSVQEQSQAASSQAKRLENLKSKRQFLRNGALGNQTAVFESRDRGSEILALQSNQTMLQDSREAGKILTPPLPTAHWNANINAYTSLSKPEASEDASCTVTLVTSPVAGGRPPSVPGLAGDEGAPRPLLARSEQPGASKSMHFTSAMLK